MKIIKNWRVFESKESVESICNNYGIQNWTLNTNGSIDVDGYVDLVNKRLTELPLKFGKVSGGFWCSGNNLTSLEGGPNWVGGDFSCHDNNLTSLEGCPNWVGGSFGCNSNKLASLEGGPSFVDGNFYCTYNNLTNLEGCPEKIFGSLFFTNNEIVSFEYYPTILTDKLYTIGNPIYEIWKNVQDHKPNNHDVLLTLFDLHGPLQFEGGEWVCHRFRLNNFFEEIGVPSPKKLKNYKEV